ncbi:hypothetical protein L2E82_32475 [Cichorium intybus]|uniref:Uncharacterized protein n=1 Tax=Cichorium intybus TaxID=13427 RepID=A0ACB9BHP0_CICIN|nr:hypothetical protein L2E82_32475 [Cichorium intybus]
MGDLGQVVHVNEFQRKATVKLLPRLNLQAAVNNTYGRVFYCTETKYTSPPPRLITSSELDAYRIRVRSSLDPDTGDLYDVVDGMKLKDGYVFKKLALDSLNFSNCKPSEAELKKFRPGRQQESNDVNTKQTINNDRVGEGSDMEHSFEVSDFVIQSHKAFGVVIGREKDDRIKVLMEGREWPVVVAVEARLLTKGAVDKNFYALDQHKKIISMNDTVRVLEGPLKNKQGIVKQIYKGVVFLHDENEEENCGYFCAKAQICEMMESSTDPLKIRVRFSNTKGGKSPPGVTPTVGFEGLSEASFAEKLRTGAQEFVGLMEEAATRCLGKLLVTLENQLRDALVELQSCKERVSAVEAERDTLRNSLKRERKKIVSVFRSLLDTEVQLVTRLKDDLRVWCERYESDV